MDILQQFDDKLTLRELACRLEVHPFDVARALGAEGSLPSCLRFDREEVDRIRERMGIETWWTLAPTVTDPIHGRGLVRSMAQMMLDRGLDENETRADNLFRGSGAEDQVLLRRALNRLIEEGVVESRPTSKGLMVRLSPQGRPVVDAIARGESYPASIEELWA